MATKKTKKKVQFWGTGRRKKAIARVRLIPDGSGSITINKRSIDEYFGLDTLKLIVRQPLELTESTAKYDVIVNVQGGGFTNQTRYFQSFGTRRRRNESGFEKSRLPHQRSESKRKKEIRSQESKKSSSVQQEIISSIITRSQKECLY